MAAQLHSIFLTDGTGEAHSGLPRRIALNVDSFRLHHPGFSHTLYGTEQGRAFIAQHFDRETVTSYDELVPLAYKADLLRYCLLFQCGGIYADVSLSFFGPLAPAPIEGRLHVFRDGFSAAPWIVSNSLIAAPAGEPLFAACIRDIVANTKQHFYGTNPLCPTGPNLFGRALAAQVPLDRIACGETLRINKNPATFSYAYVDGSGEVVAVNIKRGPGLAALGAHSNDYSQMYHERKIYRSEHPRSYRWTAGEYRTKGYVRPSASGNAVHHDSHFPAGIALSGPYVPLPAGHYRARFHVHGAGPRFHHPLDYRLDVCAGHGSTVLYSTDLRRCDISASGTMLAAEFTLIQSYPDVEVRLHLAHDGVFVFDSLELERA